MIRRSHGKVRKEVWGVTAVLLITLTAVYHAVVYAQVETAVGDQLTYLPLLMRPDDGCYFTELEDKDGTPSGAIILEPESLPLVESWVLETEHSGYTGDGYIRWSGPDHFALNPSTILTFPLQIFTPGTYQFRMHNLHDHPDQTASNDMWVRFDGGIWYKVFSFDGTGEWNWVSRFEIAGGIQLPPEYPDVQPGLHVLEIAARSFDFHLNRIALYPGSEVIDGKDLTLPASSCLPRQIQ